MNSIRIQIISSSRNEKVKRWRSLHSRKGRKEHRGLLIEGDHLLEEAVAAGWRVRSILVDEQKRDTVIPKLPSFTHTPAIYQLPSTLFAEMMDTVTPQGVAAEVEIPQGEVGSLPKGPLLLLDSIQDPGNLGTILRTAEAAGVKAVWLGRGTVDPFNAKTVRAAMGSLFRLTLHPVVLEDAIPKLKKEGVWVVGTAPRSKQLHFHPDYPQRVAFLLGNEGRGVDPKLRSLVDMEVRIPMAGQVESLSVATAAAILLFEWVRRHHN